MKKYFTIIARGFLCLTLSILYFFNAKASTDPDLVQVFEGKKGTIKPEDHNYKDAVCKPFCQPNKRHFDVGDITSNLSTAEHHSGKYSLAVAPGLSYLITSTVLPDDTASSPSFRIKLDSALYTDQIVIPNGRGLKRTYYSTDNFTGSITHVNASNVSLPFTSGCSALLPVPAQEFSPTGDRCNKFSIKWTGLLQASYSGNHSFWLSRLLDDAGTITIQEKQTNQIIYSYTAGLFPQQPPTNLVNLIKGQLYKIEVTLRNTGGYYAIDLQWTTPGNSLFHPVPLKNLYPEGMESLANNTVTAGNKVWCIKADTIQVKKKILIDSFSLLAGKRYILSAWVKEDNPDCKCVSYAKNAIQLIYNGNIYENEWQPTGNIIDGWQRYENDFILPGSATSLSIKLINKLDRPVYFDDLRIHPFNANIKTFVYNPDNLRLSAELDENNYATFYEYDDEGILTRINKETKDGIKTIKETRSALQQSIANF